MRNLFAFVYRFRGFLVFSLLQIVCVYLIVQNNGYQGAAFYNSANSYAGRVLSFQRQMEDYFRLIEVNRALVNENRRLKQSMTNIMAAGVLDSLPAAPDSLYRAKLDSITRYQLDTAGIDQVFSFIPGKVVNNSVRRINNYLTLDVGATDGVEVGMGVVSSDGVVGRVKAVSENYATVYSLLHSKITISARVKRDNTIGTIRWEGGDTQTAILDFITRDKKLLKGDTIITSGYGAYFPAGIIIGRIASVAKESDKEFYTVKVKLTPHFDQLDFVYVIKNNRRMEQDSLEIKSGVREENE